MAKKRTKKQKLRSLERRVNTQLEYKFTGSYNSEPKIKDAVYTDKSNSLGTIKKELYKSLITAILILVTLMVVYWVS